MTDKNEVIKELTMMLLYLTSWQEYPTEGLRHKPIQTAEKIRLTWKGYDYAVLDHLNGEGMILNDRGKAPIQITKAGNERAQELLRKYGLTFCVIHSNE